VLGKLSGLIIVIAIFIDLSSGPASGLSVGFSSGADSKVISYLCKL